MRKIILSIVLLSYLVASSGVIINFHYCMNNLASTGIFEPESKKCGQCGMHTDDSNGCCRDESKMVKMQNDQQPSSSLSYVLPSLSTLLHLPSNFIVVSIFNISAAKYFISHSPPLLSEQDRYLQNGVFRI